MKNIAVIGAGYVGLVTGACLAEKGNNVVIVERNPERIALLEQSKSPFYEPGLDALVASCKEMGTLRFSSSIEKAFELITPTLIFSCVGTPSMADGSADLSHVWEMAAEVGTHLSSYAVVINKSTVPVGTTQRVKMIIQAKLLERGLSLYFDCASNPEFLKEGDALVDSSKPDRIIVGVDSERAGQELKELYAPFLSDESQFVVMRIASSELTKYASNAMLATRISFMNQTALLAEKIGADIQEVKLGMSLDKRIGQHFLNAGIGYGGSCFPKDVKALVHMGKEHHQDMSLVATVDSINNAQRSWFIKLIVDFYGPALAGKTIGIWGLSFKPETDDIRDAPATDIIVALRECGAQVIVYDPVAMENVRALFGEQLIYASCARSVLEQADALIIATEWKQFLATKPADFLLLKDKVVFDARNCFDQLLMEEQGLIYRSVGRQGKKMSSRDAGSLVNPARKQFSL